MAQQLSTNTFTAATWIVNTDPTKGTHITLASALTTAVSGDTILLQSSVTENPTLKAGVNIVAWIGSELTPNISITGKCTMSTAGTVTISGIRLTTSSDFALAVTGSAASIVNLDNCYINALNNTAISYSSSSGSSAINLFKCTGNIATTGIALFASSGAGTIEGRFSFFENSGSSTTANTISAGILDLFSCAFKNPITTSSTAGCAIGYSTINCNPLNSIAFTNGGSGNVTSTRTAYLSGSASAISTSQTFNSTSDIFTSTNTNAVTGSGTFSYTGAAFSTSSNTINTTTVTRFVLDGGSYKGKNINTAPPAGMIGEQIRSYVPTGSAVSIINLTAKTITSISLTAGIWDVSACGNLFPAATTITTQFNLGISTTDNTLLLNYGDDTQQNNQTLQAQGTISISIPSLRVSLSATTTYYLVAQASFTTSTNTAYGRISATRVA